MNGNWIMQPMLALSSCTPRAVVRRLLLSIIVLPLVYAAGARLALADDTAMDGFAVQHIVSSASVEVRTMSLQIPGSALKRVSLRQVALPLSGQTYFSNLKFERHADQMIVSGWHAIRFNAKNTRQLHGGQFQSGQVQRIFLQEVRIALPYSAATGGWDVRALERELERLGVKVKPKPSLPRPTQQLSG